MTKDIKLQDIPHKDVTDHYQDFKLDIYFLFLHVIAI